MNAPTAAPLISDVPLAARQSFDQVRGQVRSGLDRAEALAVGRGYLEALAGVNSSAGTFGRLEAGWRPLEPLTLFGYGQLSSGLPGLPSSFGPVAEAGVGLRYSF